VADDVEITIHPIRLRWPNGLQNMHVFNEHRAKFGARGVSMKQLVVLALAGMTVGMVGSAKKFPLTAAASVPAARGHVDVGRDKNGNTTVELKVQHLATPENLTPPRTAYVVWFQERGAEPLNQGVLKPGKNLKATFRSVTPLKAFDVLVTAESDPNTKSPEGPEVMRASVQT
jgi:hypothetical protein